VREPAELLARERARGREHADRAFGARATAGLMPGSTPTMGIRPRRRSAATAAAVAVLQATTTSSAPWSRRKARDAQERSQM
jgi:hypothetical protein